MKYNLLTTRKVNKSLWVEIVNPPVNFLTTELVEELFFLIREVEKDQSIRVFILTGGIEDTYIRHFSIPELVRLNPDLKTSSLIRFLHQELQEGFLPGRRR